MCVFLTSNCKYHGNFSSSETLWPHHRSVKTKVPQGYSFYFWRYVFKTSIWVKIIFKESHGLFSGTFTFKLQVLENNFPFFWKNEDLKRNCMSYRPWDRLPFLGFTYVDVLVSARMMCRSLNDVTQQEKNMACNDHNDEVTKGTQY